MLRVFQTDLLDPERFIITLELVPGRESSGRSVDTVKGIAKDSFADGRISAVSITDTRVQPESGLHYLSVPHGWTLRAHSANLPRTPRSCERMETLPGDTTRHPIRINLIPRHDQLG